MRIVFLIPVLFISLLSKETCIMNFNKQVCKNFTLLNSVIVKSYLSKKELLDKLNKPIKQIAFLGENNLYLIDTNNTLDYAQELEKESYIIYAQPNISQTKDTHQYLSSQNFFKRYSLEEKWKITKGEGVKIAIIDDGFDLKHEDLKDVNVFFSYDSDYKNLDSNPKINLDTHGTQVAGIIFAQHNSIGSRGIAPNAELIAIRQTNNITSDTVISFTVASKAGANIINCSWNSPLLLEPVYDVIKYLSKDIAIVFAAGNNAKEIKDFSIEASIPQIITVGARQKYSNYGQVVDFVIPSNIETTKANNMYGSFGGTSATAPVVSGLLALKLSQYPHLSLKKVINNLKKEINGI